MRATWIVLTSALLLSGAAYAQHAADVVTASYTGTLGPARIGMTLVVEGAKVLPPSHYFYASHLTDIPLSGSVAASEVRLQEPGGGIFSLAFKGNGSEGRQTLTFENSVGMVGTWTGSGRNFPVALNGGGGSGPASARWYHDITSESDAAFEAKPQRFYRAVLAGDRDAAARYVDFPLRVNVAPGKQISITTPAQLKAQWNQIFPAAWLKQAAEAMPHDMGIADGMAMLGPGLAYFSQNGVEVINAAAE